MVGVPEQAVIRLAFEHGRAVSPVEIALAIPPGSSLAGSQRAALAAAVAEPRLAGVREDRRQNLLRWIRIVIRLGSWLTTEDDPRATSRPTRAKVCELAGFKTTTFKACRATWQEWGYIGLVRQGRTEEARRQSKRKDIAEYAGNDAAVFAICIPRKKAGPAPAAAQLAAGTRPPQGSPMNEVHPHARGANVENPDGQHLGGTALRADSPEAARTPPRSPVPVLLAGHQVLKRLSSRAVAAFWRPFRAAGWTASDWLWAINWRPDNTQHRKDLSAVRRPAGWLRWRLSFWMAGGKPILSRSQRAAVRRQAEHADRQAGRDSRAGRRAHLRARYPGLYPTTEGT